MSVENPVMRRTLLALIVLIVGVSIVIGVTNSRPVTVNSTTSLEATAMPSDPTQVATVNPTEDNTAQQVAYHKSDDPLVGNDYGPAPEFNNTIWLNTDKPLKIADQK